MQLHSCALGAAAAVATALFAVVAVVATAVGAVFAAAAAAAAAVSVEQWKPTKKDVDAFAAGVVRCVIAGCVDYADVKNYSALARRQLAGYLAVHDPRPPAAARE